VIFVTVGHQMPFDRLIRAMDDWAVSVARSDVFAQIGKSDYQPKAIRVTPFLSPGEFEHHMDEASAVVAHAGTGTIIAALQRGKPLLVLPRLSKFGETRNDHQIPTARHFADGGYVLAANDESELPQRMRELESFRPRGTIGGAASEDLVKRISEFLGMRLDSQDQAREHSQHDGRPRSSVGGRDLP
jgi:UDP-N-acetylglucosamine transferase subunit ALG13